MEGYNDPITGVDMTTGLLAASPTQNPDQDAMVARREWLGAA